jgi:hypothetical protein
MDTVQRDLDADGVESDAESEVEEDAIEGNGLYDVVVDVSFDDNHAGGFPDAATQPLDLLNEWGDDIPLVRDLVYRCVRVLQHDILDMDGHDVETSDLLYVGFDEDRPREIS